MLLVLKLVIKNECILTIMNETLSVLIREVSWKLLIAVMSISFILISRNQEPDAKAIRHRLANETHREI